MSVLNMNNYFIYLMDILRIKLVERLYLNKKIKTPGGDISFFCPNRMVYSRAHTLLTKEPETIEWIDSFQQGDVLFDIGACVGVYSLYAAVCKKIKVIAFEPSAHNYSVLIRNIELNQCESNVSAYNVALNDVTKTDFLNMSEENERKKNRYGAACSTFGVNINDQGNFFSPEFRQSTIGYSLDDFLDTFSKSIDFPNHIKIDVDFTIRTP